MPQSRRTGRLSRRSCSSARRDHPDAVGLGQFGGDLGDLLAGSGADGRDQSGLVEDLALQLLAERVDVLGGCAREFGGFAEGLVERELFQDGHHCTDGFEHASAGHAVDHTARRQHHGGGADQPTRLMHGHRGSGAEHPGLVAGTGDHAAAAQSPDQDRTPAQSGPGQLLDRREERVHVEVQHPATIHIRRCYGASLSGMAQPVGEVGEFGRWVDHFEQNHTVHAQVDAAIDFDAACRLADDVRRPLIASVRRFQLGESGDGQQLIRNAARAGDPEYLQSIRLFVAEEQQHAALLLRLLGYLGGTPMRRHWSDAIFVRLRRLMGLRTELMVLTVAEVVALSYYGGLSASAPDPVVRAVAARIVDDEHAHVRFQRHRLREGFADSGMPLRVLAFGLWWVTAIGATLVVALDHGSLLDAIGYRRIKFVRDVLADFSRVASAVLTRQESEPWT